MNKDCKIVQDLLPTYIENLTSKETNEYIKNHLKECKDCKKVLENMQNDLKVEKKQQCDAETNYMKKFNKRFKILICIILVIFIIFGFFVARKAIIIRDLNNKAEQISNENTNNKYMKEITYYTDSQKLQIIEHFNKDNRIIKKLTSYKYGEEKISEYTIYIDDNERFFLMNDDKGKKIGYPNIGDEEVNFRGGIINLFSNFEKVKIDNKDCYLVKYKNTEEFIEIETGLVIRYIDNDTNEVIDYYYSNGTVQDSDVAKPDISEYEKIES